MSSNKASKLLDKLYRKVMGGLKDLLGWICLWFILALYIFPWIKLKLSGHSSKKTKDES